MKIVVVGGTGLVGKKVVARLSGLGHEVVAASPSRGINSVTGEGLAEALAGADAVVDVINTTAWEPQAALEFFETSTKNLLAQGVRHLVALSIVGMERVPDQGYFAAKLRQEELIRESGTPYTIVRATQFAEFVGVLANGMSENGKVRVPDAQLQLIATDDVADQLVEAVLAGPVNKTYDIAGPRKADFAEFVREFLSATGDAREVVVDKQQTYFGGPVSSDELTAVGEVRLGKVKFDEWLAGSVAAAV